MLEKYQNNSLWFTLFFLKILLCRVGARKERERELGFRFWCLYSCYIYMRNLTLIRERMLGCDETWIRETLNEYGLRFWNCFEKKNESETEQSVFHMCSFVARWVSQVHRFRRNTVIGPNMLHKVERESTEWEVVENAVRMSEVLNEWLLN